MVGGDGFTKYSGNCRGFVILFDFTPLHLVVDEIMPNVARHYEEMSDGDDYGPPDIDWDTYLALSHARQCMAVTARDKGKLIGYGVFAITRNLRYRTLWMASSEGIFIEKPYRGNLSKKFLRKCDAYLALYGARETHYILSDDRVGKLLARNGYESKYKVWRVKYG